MRRQTGASPLKYALTSPPRVVVYEDIKYDLSEVEKDGLPEPVLAMLEISQLIDQLQSNLPSKRPTMQAAAERLVELQPKIVGIELPKQ